MENSNVTNTATETLATAPAIIREAHPGQLLVSMAEAARRLDCSKRTIERERDRGNIQCLRLGGRWKVSISELRRYVQSLDTK